MTSGLSIEVVSSVMSASKELGLTLKYFGLICASGDRKTNNRGRFQSLIIALQGQKAEDA